MKKKIVVVDDRPWKMKKSIQKLQENSIDFYRTVYYPNNMLDKERQNELMEDYKEGTGIEVVQVNNQEEFITQMDVLYSNPDIIFLMDYDLKGDMNRNDFSTRINVKYALAKDKNQKKIWFYTSGPRDIKALLEETFPQHIISTPDYLGGQLYWDVEQVKKMVEE